MSRAGSDSILLRRSKVETLSLDQILSGPMLMTLEQEALEKDAREADGWQAEVRQAEGREEEGSKQTRQVSASRRAAIVSQAAAKFSRMCSRITISSPLEMPSPAQIDDFHSWDFNIWKFSEKELLQLVVQLLATYSLPTRYLLATY